MSLDQKVKCHAGSNGIDCGGADKLSRKCRAEKRLHDYVHAISWGLAIRCGSPFWWIRVSAGLFVSVSALGLCCAVSRLPSVLNFLTVDSSLST